MFTSLSVLALLLCSKAAMSNNHESDIVFFEAEMFENLGGWELDQQSMGRQWDLRICWAHGLGVPVKDATTTVQIHKGRELQDMGENP